MKTVHLMGIGGTGMVATAGLFVEAGWKVRGSDENVYPPASDELTRLKVDVRSGYRPENLTPRPDLVVVGNVIPKGNPEAQALLKSDIPYVSMPKALADHFLPGRRSIVIAGTHGKTTTTSLLSWILDQSGLNPGFFIGGFPLNFGWGYRVGKGKPFVLEGDEYDTAFFEKTPKFLHYRPEDVVITSIEFDHADIYRDLSHVIEQFEKLLKIVPTDGRVFACGDHATVRDVCKRSGREIFYYGLEESNLWNARNVKATERGMKYDVLKEGRKVVSIDSPLLGRHNLVNTLACLGMAETQGVSLSKAAEAISTFKGLKRRQEFLGKANSVSIYDDFAHHPTAIAETLAAFDPLAKKCGGRLWAIFEPRSNTIRRKVFQKTLPKSFELADEVLFAPVFKKADQLSTESALNPEDVVQFIVEGGGKARVASDYNEIVQIVAKETKPGDVVVFMSNGSFGGVPQKVIQELRGVHASSQSS